ncbi:MAG: LysM peptidoglycan-binding domain-containing protein [Clostridia bacterium]|nr:LysM peptidoglycan-binding domain-containing protein [Clostridia bacterium]
MRYLMQPNENLEVISARFGVGVAELQAANPVLPGGEAYPGMIIEVPGYPQPVLPPGSYIEYVIQPGDTMYGIARRFRIGLRRLLRQNPQITNPDVIWPGQIIYLVYLG